MNTHFPRNHTTAQLNTSRDAALIHVPALYIFHIIILPYSINSLSRGTPAFQASTQPRSCRRASGAPQIALSGFGKPPTRLVFPVLSSFSYSQLPSWGGYPLMARKGLTLLPGLVRRPQHLPLGRQLRSPERSTNDYLSIYRIAGLFRTRQVSLPDSTTQRVRPAGQTHFSSNYPPPITRTSSYDL